MVKATYSISHYNRACIWSVHSSHRIFREGTSGWGSNNFSHSHWISSCTNFIHSFHFISQHWATMPEKSGPLKASSEIYSVRIQNKSSGIFNLRLYTSNGLASLHIFYMCFTRHSILSLFYNLLFCFVLFLTHNQDRETIVRMTKPFAGRRRDWFCMLYLYSAEKIGVWYRKGVFRHSQHINKREVVLWTAELTKPLAPVAEFLLGLCP